jgi:thiaminase
MPAPAPRLTEHLRALETTPSYAAATQHAFLARAGRGALPAPALAFWLHQDRVYARAYPAFVGRLLAAPPPDGDTADAALARAALLSGALANVVRELRFFESAARECALEIDAWQERRATREYTAEMARTAGDGLVDGLVFLWAMEKARRSERAHALRAL